MSALDVLIERSAGDEAAERARAELAALREQVSVLQAERQKIADSINVHLDDGTPPDNLAEHVELLMIQEYYPMCAEIDRMKGGDHA